MFIHLKSSETKEPLLGERHVQFNDDMGPCVVSGGCDRACCEWMTRRLGGSLGKFVVRQ